MYAEVSTIREILGQTRQLTAPLFQRPYVWEEKTQWEPLWNDLIPLAEARVINQNDKASHFLGAIVLDQAQSSINKPESRFIIDGQQRLITVVALMTAIRDILSNYQFIDLAKEVDELLFNSGNFADENDKFKVLPTTKDKKAYMYVVTAKSYHAVHEKWLKSTEDFSHKIIDAYKFFYSKIQSWTGEAEEVLAKCTALKSVTTSALKVVVINMTQEDDPQVIFETLNTRGTPLLPSDLIKNYLFRSSPSGEDDLVTLYNKHWRQFDDDEVFWRKKVSQGRLERLMLDLFFHHYTVMVKEKDFLVGNLFSEYKGYVSSSDLSFNHHFRDIRTNANNYKRFFQDFKSDAERVFFERLESMEITTAFPVLLKIYADFPDIEDSYEIKKIISVIESYLIRRTVCQLTTQGYNLIFLALLKRLNKTGSYTSSTVKEHFLTLTGDSGRWPDDIEFRKNWLSQPLYKKVSKGRLQMILKALNSGLETSKTEKMTIKGKLTIEHIMPQKWEDHWHRPVHINNDPIKKLEFDSIRNTKINTIGNLTLCTGSLNPSLSNKGFSEKKQSLSEHTVLLLNKFIHSTNEWNENAIEKRSNDLFDVASKIWPYPNVQ